MMSIIVQGTPHKIRNTRRFAKGRACTSRRGIASQLCEGLGVRAGLSGRVARLSFKAVSGSGRWKPQALNPQTLKPRTLNL